MKKQTPLSLKFAKLKRRLELCHWQTVGLLEALWLFTQANAPAGDIGKHSDEDIAAGIEWQGDATGLISTLVELRWLDRCEVNRLVVHDWKDHVPTYLKGAMNRHNREFAKHVPKQPLEDGTKQGTNSAELSSLHPNLTYSNLTQPNPIAALPPLLDTPEFRQAWQAWTTHRREIRKKLTPTTIERQLKSLDGMGLQRAIRCIEYTIEKGWIGLREPEQASASAHVNGTDRSVQRQARVDAAIARGLGEGGGS